jgi:hypothetical protein
MVAMSVAVLAVIAAIGIWSGRQSPSRELLREVYSPTFPDVPPRASIGDTIAQLRADLASPTGQSFLSRVLPDQGGILWLTLIVALAVGFDFRRPLSSRNIDLLLMVVLGSMFFDIMRFFRIRLTPPYWTLLDAVFSAIAFLNVALLVRAVWHAYRPGGAPGWLPNLRGTALATVTLVLVLANVYVGLARDPDDAGYFINLGAQRLRERGKMPFGDPLLTGTPGAAYGPVLYLAHVPFQWLIERQPPNPISSNTPPLGDAATYYLPPPLATKLCTITFHLAGLLALFIVGKRLTGERDVGWALVALYAGSAFVLGVGGDREFIGGMTFVSHMAPAALTVMAFASLPSPILAGIVLAAATGAGFYPGFMLPAWAGYFWQDRPKLVRFFAGFAIGATVICGATFALSRPADGRGRIGTILHDTFGHHTDPSGYGRSPFGFWGQREGIRKWIISPLVGASGLTSPAYVLLFALVAATFVIARRTSAAGLALLSASIALAFSLVKIQPTGTYVAWASPLLLIGIFADRRVAAPREAVVARVVGPTDL